MQGYGSECNDNGVIVLATLFSITGPMTLLLASLVEFRPKVYRTSSAVKAEPSWKSNALSRLEAVVRVVDLLPLGGKTRKKVHIRVGQRSAS